MQSSFDSGHVLSKLKEITEVFVVVRNKAMLLLRNVDFGGYRRVVSCEMREDFTGNRGEVEELRSCPGRLTMNEEGHKRQSEA